jgi:nucleoside 2-deoxyribosyltransferase
MTYDYFIASRFRNRDIVLPFVEQLRARGKSVYCFLETAVSQEHVGTVDENAEESMRAFESITDWWNDAGVQEIFQTDMKALRNADALILLLPAGKSAHMEAGAAYGMGKRCILIGEQKETESLYLIFAEHYDTPGQFFAALP